MDKSNVHGSIAPVAPTAKINDHRNSQCSSIIVVQVRTEGDDVPSSSALSRPFSMSSEHTLPHDVSSYDEKKGRYEKLHKVRWDGVLAIVAGFCQQTLCWGMIMTYGTVLSYYTCHLLPNTSKLLICLIGAVPGFFVLAMSLLWGRLLDAGHHKKINTFGGVCLTAGMIGLAFSGGNGTYGAGKVWAILLAAIPVGIGQSCYFVAAPHTAATWYPKCKGRAIGFTNSGAALGGVVYPFVFVCLTYRNGFSAGVGGLAGLTGFLAIFIIFAARPNPAWQPRPVENKKQIGTWFPRAAFRSRTLQIHIAAMCCIYSSILSVPFFLEYWAQVRGLGKSEDTSFGPTGIRARKGSMEFWLVVIFNAWQFFGRLTGSVLTDRFHARAVHLVACLYSIIVISAFWLTAQSYAAAVAFAALFGIGTGVMVSLPINDVADILGPSRGRLFGQYAGVVYLCASPFILAGPVITGVLEQEFGIWTVGAWACGGLAAGALLLGLGLCLRDDTEMFDEQAPRESLNSSCV